MLTAKVIYLALTHRGLVTPYRDKHLGQQAITLYTNASFYSVGSSAIHLREISQQIVQRQTLKLARKLLF